MPRNPFYNANWHSGLTAAEAALAQARRDEAAVTVDLTINFLRPAMTLPLLAVATALRAGRRLFTAEVRITEETSGRLVSHATTTYALSLPI